MSCEVLETLVLMRGAERLVIVCGGIAAIAAGTLLFRWGVGGEASLETERGGDWRFRLLNASPGVFFALFGCVVLLWGLAKPFGFEPPPAGNGQAAADAPGPKITYADLGEPVRDLIERAADADPGLPSAQLKVQLEGLRGAAREILRREAGTGPGGERGGRK